MSWRPITNYHICPIMGRNSTEKIRRKQSWYKGKPELRVSLRGVYNAHHTHVHAHTDSSTIVRLLTSLWNMQIFVQYELICVCGLLSFFSPPPPPSLSLPHRGNNEWQFIVLRFHKNYVVFLLHSNFVRWWEHDDIVDGSAIFKFYYVLWKSSYYPQYIDGYYHLGILSVTVLLSAKFFLEVILHIFSGGRKLYFQILSTNLFRGKQ